ncbi:Wzy polymerase domain-containing protein [Hafnia paralvei]|uniref:PglL family O-oligosaccharyltransferase n=1 Tax=Hafnia paralvei TaxID=546367 RepID=UPI003CF79E35
MLNNKRLIYCIVIVLASYFIIFMHIYIPNMGGTGLKLPGNILCWSVIIIVILLAGVSLFYTHSTVQSLTLKYFVLGSILLSIPALYSPHLMISSTLTRLAGLWGGIALFWALLQMRFTVWQKKFLLFSLLVGALLEWGITLWQLETQNYDNWMEFAPGTRPYGIFQQINVLASFLATGYAIAAWFCLNKSRRLLVKFSCTAIVLLAAILMILQSRVGYLGAATVLLIFCGIYYREPGKIYTVVILSACGVIGGELLLHSHWLSPLVEHVDKEYSNNERIHIMRAAIEMIRQRPIAGWGYGQFEFTVARISQQVFQHTFSLPITHAHNEFLYGWAEGGIAAAAGMLTIACGYLALLKDKNRSSFSMWVLSLPIALHLMTEYPLYQSAIHWLTLILLCRLCINEDEPVVTEKRAFKALSILVVSASCCVLIFLISGFKTNQVLTNLERSGMRDFTPATQLTNPWIQWERYNYDRHVAMLLQYNVNRNPAILGDFYNWGRDYVEIHNDKSIYRYLVAIAHYQNNYQQERQLLQQLYLLN